MDQAAQGGCGIFLTGSILDPSGQSLELSNMIQMLCCPCLEQEVEIQTLMPPPTWFLWR